IEEDPNAPNFHVPDLVPVAGMTVDRLGHREQLLTQVDSYRRDLDQNLEARQLSDAQDRAFTLATSTETRHAFDLSKEPEALRERYGHHTWGQSMLLARRLAQAGVKFIQVNIGGLNAWDYHQSEDARMDVMMP